jgi:hypothetical protein
MSHDCGEDGQQVSTYLCAKPVPLIPAGGWQHTNHNVWYADDLIVRHPTADSINSYPLLCTGIPIPLIGNQSRHPPLEYHSYS